MVYGYILNQKAKNNRNKDSLILSRVTQICCDIKTWRLIHICYFSGAPVHHVSCAKAF